MDLGAFGLGFGSSPLLRTSTHVYDLLWAIVYLWNGAHCLLRETSLHSAQRIFTLSEFFRDSSVLTQTWMSWSGLEHCHPTCICHWLGKLVVSFQTYARRVEPEVNMLDHSIFKNLRATVFMLFSRHKWFTYSCLLIKLGWRKCFNTGIHYTFYPLREKNKTHTQKNMTHNY